MKRMNTFLLGLVSGLIALPLGATDREVDVVVTPSVLVQNDKGPACVTVHANVPYQDVDLKTATLTVTTETDNEAILKPVKLCADDSGDLVAKFDKAQVLEVFAVNLNGSAGTACQEGKRVAAPSRKAGMEIAIVTFEVMKLDNDLFSGSCIVRVK